MAELSRATGKHPSTIYNIESGDSNPHTSTVKRLADALGVDVVDLVVFKDAA